jgi:cyanophycinase
MPAKRASSFHTFLRSSIFSAALCLTVFPAVAEERLILVGGGPRPPAALSRFVEWAGKDQPRILVIAWATQEPQASFKAIVKDFASYRTTAIELAPIAPLTSDTRKKFLSQLKEATGVFFTGGDQVRIMNVLKDVSLADALRERYHAGVVFGGTSAGTAIMSRRMITGEGEFTVIDGEKVQTSEGLGLLPESVIVDQHFIKRQRSNRLFGLVLKDRKALGVGIDEGTALIVSNNRYAEVVGASQVMLIDALARQGALTIYLIKPGEKIDLLKRAPSSLVSSEKSSKTP